MRAFIDGGLPLLVAAEGGAEPAPTWLWVATLVVAPLLIAFDLFVVARLHPRLGARASFVWTSVWFLAGLAFALLVAAAAGSDYGVKYSTGYLVEKALTLDQVFVMALILRTWHAPDAVARRLVFVSLWVLLLLRLPFIALGWLLAETESTALRLTMAGLFVFGGVVLLRTRTIHPDPAEQPAVRALNRVHPVVPDYVGHELVVERDGRKVFTLAAVVLTALLTADVYFGATVPLAFAFTKPPFIVLASSTLALLGVRSMYVFAASIGMDLVMLKVALALSMWLVAVDLVVSPYLEHPSGLVPILVLLLVGLPIAVCWFRTERSDRTRNATTASNAFGPRAQGASPTDPVEPRGPTEA